MRRRDFLQIGVGAVLGLGFSDILRLRANAAVAQTGSRSGARQVNCIMVWLDGGPSHYETFDPKPDAPRAATGTGGVRRVRNVSSLVRFDGVLFPRRARRNAGLHVDAPGIAQRR